MNHLVGSFILAAWIGLVGPFNLFAETTAYMPNEGDHNIKRVFVSDETNFSEVDACQGPYGAAVTPNGNTLVVTCTDDNYVSIIPTANFLDVAAPLDVDLGSGHEPRGVAIESRGTYAYVANYGNNTVDEIILSSGSITSTFSVGSGPWGITATYDSVEAEIKVYVANHDADTLSVISGGSVDTITGVGDGPLGVALTPDGSHIYVSIYNDDEVVVIDTSDWAIETTITVGDGPWGLAMADDGAFVFVTNSLDNTVSMINTANRTVTGTYATGAQPMGVAAPVNGAFVYAVNQGANNVTKVTTGGVSSTIGSGQFNGAFSLGAFIGDSRPNAPSALAATVDASTEISLSWTDNAGDELGFKIERREDSDSSYSQIAKVGENVTSYDDLALEKSTTYHYRIRAYKEASDSDYSASASATTEDDDFSWCFINTLVKQ